MKNLLRSFAPLIVVICSLLPTGETAWSRRTNVAEGDAFTLVFQPHEGFVYRGQMEWNELRILTNGAAYARQIRPAFSSPRPPPNCPMAVFWSSDMRLLTGGCECETSGTSSRLARFKVRIWRFDVTVYSGQELRALVEQAGFTNVKLLGSFDGEEYGLNAQRLIVMARRPLRSRTQSSALNKTTIGHWSASPEDSQGLASFARLRC